MTATPETTRKRPAEDVIQELRAMHKPRTQRHGSGCVQCGILWPCPTRLLVDSAVQDEQPDPRFTRRIYIDGEGDPWIEIPMSPDDGSVAIVQLREDVDVAAPAEEIRKNTGGLREIGRCA